MSKCKEGEKTPYEEAKEIARLYFVACRILEHGRTMNDSKEITMNDCKSYIMRVKDAYNQLDLVDKRIINNDFFFNDYPGWWTGVYTKSTYYRLRSRSIKNFLEAFDNA